MILQFSCGDRRLVQVGRQWLLEAGRVGQRGATEINWIEHWGEEKWPRVRPKRKISSCMRQPISSKERRREQLTICSPIHLFTSWVLMCPGVHVQVRRQPLCLLPPPCVFKDQTQVLGLVASAIRCLSHLSPRYCFSSFENEGNVPIKGKCVARSWQGPRSHFHLCPFQLLGARFE